MAIGRDVSRGLCAPGFPACIATFGNNSRRRGADGEMDEVASANRRARATCRTAVPNTSPTRQTDIPGRRVRRRNGRVGHNNVVANEPLGGSKPHLLETGVNKLTCQPGFSVRGA